MITRSPAVAGLRAVVLSAQPTRTAVLSASSTSSPINHVTIRSASSSSSSSGSGSRPPRFLRPSSSSRSAPPSTQNQYQSPSFGIKKEPDTQPDLNVHPLSFRDADIPYRTVRLVDPTTNHLLDPQPLRSILASYNQATHTLVLVSVDNKAAPIVKLVDKVEERRKERESEDKAKLRRKMALEEKEVQVSWQSAQGDIKHKLDLAKSLLEKGDSRVQVVFANRKRGENVPDPKKVEIIASFDQVLGEVGNKWKDDSRSRGLWVLYYNPLESARSQVQSKVRQAENDKRKEKEEKKEARRRKEEERRAKAEARAKAEEEQLAAEAPQGASP
ncbi:hypothetical protein I316_00593 [Kwoniella heveanensis BCC8398]|uniref:Translation initiation factor 3 N-terminal domain-containing protein n=1 Tax=Kwoniella heveanensis BCC8398 TaxID=1296120 RepID=A0A1B9H2I2_9TREE|nr:hypothetical protein I316_00593 [Kwoniella heveanensis BCC8398]